MLIGRCLPYGEGITYWPLAEVAKAHAGILDNDPAEAALAKLRAAIESVVGDEHSDRVLDAAAWTIGFSLPGTPVTDSDPREAVRLLEEGWARYVSALGRERVAIVAVEDVHWASSPLLDLIERLAERLADTHVLLVCTARLELLELRPTWGAGKQNATTLSLDAAVTRTEAAELVSSLLGEADVPEEVRDRVLAARRGQPVLPRGDAEHAHRPGRARAPERRLGLDRAAGRRHDPGLRPRRDRRADRPPRRRRHATRSAAAP